MTIGLKEANNYYLQLVMEFPPRPIKNDEELIATQNRVNVILNKRILQGDFQEKVSHPFSESVCRTSQISEKGKIKSCSRILSANKNLPI